ncbi:SsrA-binding protein SmpB [Poriferisphaera sp. WC338]|uniref:SsrA-binding protein SmpB n=1 Tax=Poriferisphaera sp. WC338 TaxID=3425129 RepID=UPI003D813BB4
MAKQKKQKKKDENITPRIANRRAFHDYHITDNVVCGIVLQGSEVKSLRQGQASIAEGYAYVDEKTLELFLMNCEISRYPHGGPRQHEPKRKRKLLAQKREIKQLANKTREKGTTIVPIAMFFNKDGRIKIEIGIGVGKKQHDKRQDIKKRDADREMRRSISRRR